MVKAFGIAPSTAMHIAFDIAPPLANHDQPMGTPRHPIVTSHTRPWHCGAASQARAVYSTPEQPLSLPRSKPLALLCCQQCTVAFDIAPPLAKHELPDGMPKHPIVMSHTRPWHCSAAGQARAVHRTPKQPPRIPCSWPLVLLCRRRSIISDIRCTLSHDSLRHFN